MGRMGELADAVSELKRCGEILIGVSETLTELFSAAEPDSHEPPKKPKAAMKEKQPEPEIKAPALEDVRAVLADKSRQGYTSEVKEILRRHGAEKLSAVDPADYAAVLAEAEVLGNG